jgi:hypothetical protein
MSTPAFAEHCHTLIVCERESMCSEARKIMLLRVLEMYFGVCGWVSSVMTIGSQREFNLTTCKSTRLKRFEKGERA